MYARALPVLLLALAALPSRAGDPSPPDGAADTARRAHVTVEASIVIQRPVAEVFAFVSDAENDLHWRSEVVSMENLDAPPHGVGTRTLEVAEVLGRRLETTTEITEFVPGARLARRTVSGPTPVDTARTVVAAEGGARFTYRLRADVTDVALFKALRPLLQWWTQRKIEGYLSTLKTRLEAAPSP